MLGPPARRAPGGERLELLDVDRDRERADARDVVVATHVGAVDLGVEQSPGGGDEVLRAELTLEPEQVGTEQALHDLLAPRDAGEQLVGRERDVVEEADPHVGALVAEHLRHELQVIVVDPHHRVRRRDLRQRVGEAPVHPHVGLPLPFVVAGLTDRVVVQRPQGVVRETLVVGLDIVGREHHGVQLDAVGLERRGVVVRDTRPPDPRPAALAQEREQRPHETAGAGLPSVVRARHREAVGGDDEGTLRHREANA